MIDLLFSDVAAATLPRNARAVDTENGSELFPGCLNEIGNKIANRTEPEASSMAHATFATSFLEIEDWPSVLKSDVLKDTSPPC